MDYASWRRSLAKDAEVLSLLTLMVGDITPEHDSKLQELFAVLKNKMENPINEGNRKVIIFTAFAEMPSGYPYRYIMLTMDRQNFPGMPNPNWTYGGMYFYGANVLP